MSNFNIIFSCTLLTQYYIQVSKRMEKIFQTYQTKLMAEVGGCVDTCTCLYMLRKRVPQTKTSCDSLSQVANKIPQERSEAKLVCSGMTCSMMRDIIFQISTWILKRFLWKISSKRFSWKISKNFYEKFLKWRKKISTEKFLRKISIKNFYEKFLWKISMKNFYEKFL